MRILLLSPNEELLPDPVFPLGLACLAGALVAAGHEYQIIDLCMEPLAALPERVRAFDPEVIAVSLRNIDNVSYPHSTSYLPVYRQLCRQLRGLANCPLVLGGAGYSLFPERLLAELQADFGVVGSGEEPFVALLRALENRTGFEAIPNLLIREHTGITATTSASMPAPGSRPLRQPPHLDAYRSLGGMANVQTKRGCPFGCIYCSYPLIEGRTATMRPVESVVAELRDLAAAGFDEIYFVDSIFNHPLAYAKDICRGILEAGIALRWTCYGTPMHLDQEAVALFKESGCIGIEFGTDSLSDVTLKTLGKSFTVKDVEQASALCAANDLPFCHAVLMGGPGETEATFKETVERLGRINPTAVVFMTGIRVIPGTRLYAVARQENLITASTDMLEPVFYLAHAIQPILEKEVSRLSRLHKNWIFPGHSIRCSQPLAKKLRDKGVRGPLWLNLTNMIPR